MKYFKLSFLAGMASMLVMGLTGSALAFHDGGVGACDGCHTMHNSYKGLKVTITGAVLVGNPYLLIGSDASSTCLNCHGPADTTVSASAGANSFHIDTDAAGYTGTTLPVEMTPGGDFAWLKTSLSNVGVITAAPSEALNRHGHHIVAGDYNFQANTDNSGLAPGGTYLATDLSCASCHNPHSGLTLDGSTLPISGSGSYGGTPVAGTALGVYRLLGGINYILPGTTYFFAYAPPAAVAPLNYNQPDVSVPTQTRVAYGQGMSEWCANCHLGIYNLDPTADVTHRHVASNVALLNQVMPDGVTNAAAIYNGYVNTGNITGGSQTSSYLALVPYELGTSDQATLLPYASDGAGQVGATALSGPVLGTENVMCLSCHRAHASGFDSMTRFDAQNEFVTDPTGSYCYIGADLAEHVDTSGYIQAALNGLPSTFFGLSQRMLCNKCHAKD